MCLVDFHGHRTQDYAPILSLSQEHGPELSIALNPLEESELSTLQEFRVARMRATSLQSLPDLDRPSTSTTPLGLGPLLRTGARRRAGHGLVDIQRPLSQRSVTSVILLRDILLFACPETTEPSVWQLQPF